MFNEDKRPGPVSEKNWGLFFTNGSSVYTFSLSTSNRITGNNSDFCVAKPNADPGKLQVGLNWACGQGGANCSAIQEGQPCYLPNTYQNHASYAYNDYYQKMHLAGATCDFDGTATTTTANPSKSIYPFLIIFLSYFSGLLVPCWELLGFPPQGISFSSCYLIVLAYLNQWF
jgi:hypothetical protein